MAEIELVIKIPEETYEYWKNSCYSHKYVFAEAIKNGTQLPKGHGRLIAEPTERDIAKTIGGQNDFAECIRESVKAVFYNAPTIIEADKEQE